MPTLDEIVARFGGEIVGAGGTAIARIAPLDAAMSGDLTFLSNRKYRPQLAITQASAVILAPPVVDCPVAAIVTQNPYLYYAKVAQWLNPPPAAPIGIHPSAVVEGTVTATASIGPHVFIAAGATIADGAVIGANCSILGNSHIGAGSRLHANVTVYPGCTLGQRCIVHAGAVIGADGFGFAREGSGEWVKIPQVGGVRIGDDVEIGACTTIDRGALTDTIIGDGVKLDNQIQIAHNVRIGAHTAIAGCVGIAGSTVFGERCTVGGAAMIIGHLNIGDDVNISSGTFVAKHIPSKGSYTGSVPFLEHAQWLKNYSHLRHLDAMADKMKAMERRIAELEKRHD